MLIVLVGVALGVAANVVSPKRIPWITPPKVEPAPSEYIPLEDAVQLWKSSAGIFLDARAPADYAAGHIAGAHSLPAEAFNEHIAGIGAYLTPESKIIVYCDGEDCDLSHDVLKQLRGMQFTNVHILRNGMTVWRGAKLAIQTGDQP